VIPVAAQISRSAFFDVYASCAFRINDYSHPANLFPARNDDFFDRLIDDTQADDLKAQSVTLLSGNAHSVTRLPGNAVLSDNVIRPGFAGEVESLHHRV
jgi:hypothetical protein